tara:strand:- start:1068 stop:1442 length:375 start_codon:yes stop_codon:yes gene_type:complete
MGSGGSKSSAPQLSINAADADVPMVPPIMLILLCTASLILAKTVTRYRFLPDELSALKTRVAIFTLATSIFARFFLESRDELHAAGSGVAFTPVAGIATTGPYAHSRNPLYVSSEPARPRPQRP